MDFICIVEYQKEWTPKETAYQLFLRLQNTKVLYLKNVEIDHLDYFYDSVIDKLQKLFKVKHDKFQRKWLEVKYDPKKEKDGRPRFFHNDEASFSSPNDIDVMYCVKKEGIGGNNIFLNGEAIFRELEKFDKKLLNILQTNSFCFSRDGESRNEHVFTVLENRVYINWDFRHLSDVEIHANKKIADRFHKFIEEKMRNSNEAENIKLSQSEAMIWWDGLVLHARERFQPSNGLSQRYYRKTGFKI